MDKENYTKDGVHMVASKGVILSVKGKTAKRILAGLENPNINENLIKDCTAISKELKGTQVVVRNRSGKIARPCKCRTKAKTLGKARIK